MFFFFFCVKRGEEGGGGRGEMKGHFSKKYTSKILSFRGVSFGVVADMKAFHQLNIT